MSKSARELRRELADRVTAELASDLPRVSAYFGEDYVESDEPEARAMRRRGGTFEWVAFGFDPHSMWDTHVGVLTADGQVTAGIHVHERLAETRPETAAVGIDDIDVEYRYSDAAAEHQFNRPSVPLEAVDIDVLASEITMLCRRFEPEVDELES